MAHWQFGRLIALVTVTVVASAAETETGSISVDGRQRTFLCHQPPGLRPTGRPVPLMFVLHGGNGSGRKMRRLTATAFDALADREGFVVVYPDGIEHHWNDGRPGLQDRPHAEHIDDVGFIDALIEHLTTSLPVDRRRVYVTGMSNGAMMTHRLALALPHRIAAAAPVSGSLPVALAKMRPRRPVPMLIINGTDDPIVPYAGGPIRLFGHSFGDVLSTPATVRFWVAANGCGRTPETTWLPDADPGDGTWVRRERYRSPDGTADVMLYAVKGGGHTWPGGRQHLGERIVGRTSRDIDAARVIWAFCRKHVRPTGVTAPASAASPAYDRPGPDVVKTLDFPDLRDASRGDRRVPMTVHFPAAGGPFPLVIFSHGGGGNRNSHVAQAQHLASHGYVAICVEHVYSNSASLRRRMRAATGARRLLAALHAMTKDPQAVLQRPRDVSFAIDQATHWNAVHPVFKGRIDVEKVAVMGHSFGAFTTLAVCGARPTLDELTSAPPPGHGLGPDLSDPRVVFGLAMSPQTPDSGFFAPDSYRGVTRPLICLTGSRDVQKGRDGRTLPASTRRRLLRLLPPGGKVWMCLENAGHIGFSYDPDARVQLLSRARPEMQRISRAMMVLFCDHYLKRKPEARRWMTPAYARSLCGGHVPAIEWREK